MRIAGILKSVNPDGSIIVADIASEKEYKFFVKEKYIDELKKLEGENIVVYVSNGKVKKIARVLKFRVYGIPPKTLRAFVGEIKRKRGAFQSILGFDISFESILDIIAILIWLALFAFALVYYLLVLPVVYLVASIITLGEVWKMRHKYFVVIPAQQIDTLRDNLRKIVKKKAFIKGLPENIVDGDIRRAFSKLSKVYTIFDFGRILIGLALIVTLGIYIYYWSSSFTGGFIEFARSSGLWIYPVGIFTLGFLLIIIAGLARGLMKIKV